MKMKTTLVLVVMFGMLTTHVMADATRDRMRAWLEYHAAESLNVTLGQHKKMAEGRNQTLKAYLKAKGMTSDFQKADTSKQLNPKNLTFDQMLTASMHNEVKLKLPPIPSDQSTAALQREASASVKLAKSNYDALMPMVKKNQEMQAFLKSKNLMEDYDKWSGEQVQKKKAAYDSWLKTAKAQQQQDQVKTDAARRKALMAISASERAQRAENLQRKMQYVQSQQQYQQQRYAIKHYHPVYNYGDPYRDVGWRYRHPNDGGVLGGGQGQGMPNVGSDQLGEANAQLNQAVDQSNQADKAAKDAESAVIDAESKQASDLLKSQDAMPSGEQLPSDEIQGGSPTDVTKKAAEEAAELVPDVNRTPSTDGGPEQPEQPAAQPQGPAQQPQGPAAQ